MLLIVLYWQLTDLSLSVRCVNASISNSADESTYIQTRKYDDYILTVLDERNLMMC